MYILQAGKRSVFIVNTIYRNLVMVSLFRFVLLINSTIIDQESVVRKSKHLLLVAFSVSVACTQMAKLTYS